MHTESDLFPSLIWARFTCSAMVNQLLISEVEFLVFQVPLQKEMTQVEGFECTKQRFIFGKMPPFKENWNRQIILGMEFDAQEGKKSPQKIHILLVISPSAWHCAD